MSEIQPDPGIQGKFFWGETFELLQKQVDDWIKEVNVHLYRVGKATKMEENDGWLVTIVFYSPSCIYHKTCVLEKENG